MHDWDIIPFEMKRSWMNMLTGWIEFNESIKGPGLYQTQLEITEEPKDTFVETTGWSKGSNSYRFYVAVYFTKYFRYGICEWFCTR